MKLPWTAQFVRNYYRLVTPQSLLRLRSAMLAERDGRMGFTDTVAVRLRRPRPVGITIRPVSNDIYTVNEIFVEKVYAAAAARLRDVRTVIDLGANIGLASLYFLGEFPQSRVLALEPDHRNFQFLDGNLSSFQRDGRAMVMEAAFWPTDCQVIFDAPKEPGHVNQGAARSAASAASAGGGAIVQGLTMRSILAKSGFGNVDLLKVDIEGGERHLFAGDLAWLDCVTCIVLEFHAAKREESGFDSIKARKGFKVIEPNSHTILALRN